MFRAQFVLVGRVSWRTSQRFILLIPMRGLEGGQPHRPLASLPGQPMRSGLWSIRCASLAFRRPFPVATAILLALSHVRSVMHGTDDRSSCHPPCTRLASASAVPHLPLILACCDDVVVMFRSSG